MSAEYSEEEQSLLEQVERSERTLADLKGDLHSVDGELEALAKKSHQYDVLAQACQFLEELDAIGAAQLFWGEYDGPGRADDRIRRARPGRSPPHSMIVWMNMSASSRARSPSSTGSGSV